jgi:hypothetical protein
MGGQQQHRGGKMADKTTIQDINAKLEKTRQKVDSYDNKNTQFFFLFGMSFLALLCTASYGYFVAMWIFIVLAVACIPPIVFFGRKAAKYKIVMDAMISQKQTYEKCEQLILVLCALVGKEITIDKLACLLYYADFGYYEFADRSRSITGIDYYVRANHKGGLSPCPEHLDEIMDDMAKNGRLTKIRQDTYATSASAEDTFTTAERFIIGYVIRQYGNRTASELLQSLSKEAPLVATRKDERISYALADYRGTKF